jgi:hypothetical protein
VFVYTVVGRRSARASTPLAHKSAPVTNLDNGDALMIDHRGQKIFKSNTKVSEATHERPWLREPRKYPPIP